MNPMNLGSQDKSSDIEIKWSRRGFDALKEFQEIRRQCITGFEMDYSGIEKLADILAELVYQKEKNSCLKNKKSVRGVDG